MLCDSYADVCVQMCCRTLSMLAWSSLCSPYSVYMIASVSTEWAYCSLPWESSMVKLIVYSYLRQAPRDEVCAFLNFAFWVSSMCFRSLKKLAHGESLLARWKAETHCPAISWVLLQKLWGHKTSFLPLDISSRAMCAPCDMWMFLLNPIEKYMITMVEFLGLWMSNMEQNPIFFSFSIYIKTWKMRNKVQ